jgi:VWFA-related protein
MSTSRVRRSLLVAAGLCVLAGSGPAGPLRGQQAETPTFRADASYVLTDVFVTRDGTPVTDLTAADFEVREDGVLQTVRSFEAILHRGQPSGPPRRNPSTVAESQAAAADPRRRVFVFFIDTFHVGRAESMQIRQAVQRFLKSALGSDDLIAYMTPHMSGSDISFSTSTEPLVRFFEDNPVWGVADEPAGAESDPVEQDMHRCFGVGRTEDLDWLGLRSRLREEKSLTALRGLVSHLDGLRESRKAVIALTGGWRLFGENPTRMSGPENDGRIVGVNPVGHDPATGKLGMPARQRLGNDGTASQKCDTTRLLASFADSRLLFRDLVAEANRSSTSFYTVDARGLRTEMRPQYRTAEHNRGEMLSRERTPFSTTLDSIRDLAVGTNGLVADDSNDIEAGLHRAIADLNAYYLLGYVSTNGKADGKYRKIRVTVKRPGVQVRAREGYLARRLDGPAPPGTTAPVNPETARVTAALGKLAPARPGVPLVVSAAAGAVPGGTARVIRVVAELDAATAASGEWAEGSSMEALVRDAKGETVTSGKATLAKGVRTAEVELPVVDGLSGEVKVQVRLQGTGPLARYTDTTAVSLDAAAGWGAPRLSRRGPSTGIAWVPTADPRFRRQERVRVAVSAPSGAAGPITGTLLDRQGKPINVPVRIDQPVPPALVAELALAPLAVGDYVLALGEGPGRLLVPLRIVP